jgi:fimbrial chaperone protein
VSPVSVTLAEGAASTNIVVTNRGTVPVRLQATLFAWDQLPNGEMALKPTQDVLFFPAMLTLNPKEARHVRIGTRVKPGAVERTYRIFLQELPPVVRSQEEQSNSVRMLTKMAIPIFIAPPSPKAKPQLAGLAVRSGKVAFQVRNGGNKHMRVQKVVLRIKNGERELHTESLDGWYVLAGGVRQYEVKLEPSVCDSAGRFEVELQSDAGPARATLDARCLP